MSEELLYPENATGVPPVAGRQRESRDCHQPPKLYQIGVELTIFSHQDYFNAEHLISNAQHLILLSNQYSMMSTSSSSFHPRQNPQGFNRSPHSRLKM